MRPKGETIRVRLTIVVLVEAGGAHILDIEVLRVGTLYTVLLLSKSVL